MTRSNGTSTYTADGRPDETLGGKLYQHYGFKSSPPAGVELVHMEQGNNGFSVAENDGNIMESLGVSGDVSIYAIHNGKVNSIALTENFVSIITDTANPQAAIVIEKDTDVTIQAPGKISLYVDSGKVYIGKYNTNPILGQTLANKTFITAVGVALTALGQPGFDPATIASGVYNSKSLTSD